VIESVLQILVIYVISEIDIEIIAWYGHGHGCRERVRLGFFEEFGDG
jgi:hypothetical protein